MGQSSSKRTVKTRKKRIIADKTPKLKPNDGPHLGSNKHDVEHRQQKTPADDWSRQGDTKQKNNPRLTNYSQGRFNSNFFAHIPRRQADNFRWDDGGYACNAILDMSEYSDSEYADLAILTPCGLPADHAVEFLEFCFEVDEVTALHKKKTNCKKYPNHGSFISAEDFKMEHLPERHRDQLYLDYIKAVIGLTVRLVLSYVSCDRPDKYPFFMDRGKPIQAYGSGWVWCVDRKFTDMDGQSCPCPECQTLPDKERKKQWGKFGVDTALHVVFNTEECKSTTVNVDYNRDTDHATCPKLHGFEVGDRDKDEDRCEMYVVSHDEKVCLMLEERVNRYIALCDKLDDKHMGQGESENPSIICVSHPHGMSKHVSVGEYLCLDKEKGKPDHWGYTTHTCPGSSGAPLIRLGKVDGDPGDMSNHSRYISLQGYNASGRTSLWWYPSFPPVLPSK